MANGLRRTAAACIVVTAVFAGSPGISGNSDRSALTSMEHLAGRGDSAGVRREARLFFRKFPKSKFVPDVRLLLAETEINPDKSLRLYRVVLDNYRYYEKRDYAHYKLCSVLYLLSRWNDLRKESHECLRDYPRSPHRGDFMLYNARALIFLEKFDEARDICITITTSSHDYEKLSQALLLLAYINRNTTGYSRSYLITLRDLIVGFRESQVAPAAIYLLGRCYEDKRDYNRAYSAFLDIQTKYPRSPEAVYVQNRLPGITRHNPVPVDYMPTDSAIRSSDRIDIRPETEPRNSGKPKGVVYSVSLGPMRNKHEASEIAGLIRRDFAPIRVIHLRDHYLVYAGRVASQQKAISIKIRLAEEFGLNGRVVRIVSDSNKTYIYGD